MSVMCFSFLYIFHRFLHHGGNHTFIIAAFGASAVLVFSEYTSKNSFTRILLISGIAAFLGVFINLSDLGFISKILLAIGSCIFLLNLINIHYPPAGAIVLIPLIAGDEIKELGYLYIIYPTLTGITIIYSFSILKKQLKQIIYHGK